MENHGIDEAALCLTAKVSSVALKELSQVLVILCTSLSYTV